MVVTNSWCQKSQQFSVGVYCYHEWKRSNWWCSARESWVARVGTCFWSSTCMLKEGSHWISLLNSIVFVSHHKLPWAFTMVSVTAIDKSVFDFKCNLCTEFFLLIAEFGIKNNVEHSACVPSTCAADLHSIIYKARKLHPLNWLQLIS